ncbi:MAG: BNR-4 repeat-containing protein [Verrucomicrobia bacterium]|nr:BNR-4 repeat-containing protein [Verrucomicrobiota bacterium]MCH8525913.1 BNR repeat-containing protein [Kiritimatiellia bacterium]
MILPPETAPPFSGSPARFDPPGEDLSLPERRMPDPADQPLFCKALSEFRGVWHGQPAFFPEFGPKYGGGLATYPYQTRPMAVYAKAVNKTFFCWGGSLPDSDPRTRFWDFGPGGLLQMVSAYDHENGRLLDPVCVFDKWCADPHDNPALQMDPEGYLWLFSPSHGNWTTRSFIHKSVRPYDHTRWETVSDSPLFAYPQIWVDGRFGWMFFHTRYAKGRGLWIKFSSTGHTWSEPVPLADFGCGHYQVSCFDEASARLGLAFDYHPEPGGLDARTNLYFMQSFDGGRTFRTAEGGSVETPVLSRDHSCRVYDYEAEGKVVYLRDLRYTAEGEPVILYVTSRGHEPGPERGPHTWHLAGWSADAGWTIRTLFSSDNNYDHGELWIGEKDWRILAPTETGPQPYNPGGELALWVSKDQGRTWRCERRVTQSSRYNHTFCRVPVNAHPEFHSFWADGHAREPSESSLYFCDREGTAVRRMNRTPLAFTQGASEE